MGMYDMTRQNNTHVRLGNGYVRHDVKRGKNIYIQLTGRLRELI